jgi:hypothetical protein
MGQKKTGTGPRPSRKTARVRISGFTKPTLKFEIVALGDLCDWRVFWRSTCACFDGPPWKWILELAGVSWLPPPPVQKEVDDASTPHFPFPSFLHRSTMLHILAIAALLSPALADITTGIPDSAPPGFEAYTSPIVVPAPDTIGQGDWASATKRARAFVAKLTLPEKINITTGVDVQGRCVGNTGKIPRLGWEGLCLQDSPLGVRLADFVSAFPASINVAATWDKSLFYQRGAAMGKEHRGKGVNVALGPMTNMGAWLCRCVLYWMLTLCFIFRQTGCRRTQLGGIRRRPVPFWRCDRGDYQGYSGSGCHCHRQALVSDV